jgi:hypothetical protein
MGHFLGKTKDITAVHFYRTTGQVFSGFRGKAEKAGFVVVMTFMQDHPMLARRYLKATVHFGYQLQRIPHGNDMCVFRIAIILRILVPWCIGPFLIWQFRSGVEYTMHGDFFRAQKICSQVQQDRMNENPVHLRADQIASRTPGIMGSTGILPHMHQSVLEIYILVWFVRQATLYPFSNGLFLPTLEDIFCKFQ